MLGDFITPFDQSGDKQIFAVGIAENHAGAIRRGNAFRVIPPANRPRVIFRYADSKDLLISGLVEGGDEIAQHPAVVDAPSGKGHVVLFSINPVYRGETWGTYSMVLNTILNFDNLNAGRKDATQ